MLEKRKLLERVPPDIPSIREFKPLFFTSINLGEFLCNLTDPKFKLPSFLASFSLLHKIFKFLSFKNKRNKKDPVYQVKPAGVLFLSIK